MLNLPAYEIKEELHYGVRTVAYRAIRLADNKKVILKTLRQLDHPPLKELAAIQHEYDMLENMDIEGVIHVYDIVKVGDANVLVLEDMGGKTLKDFLSGRKIRLEQFFKIALQLVKIIGSLHQKNIIHKDIKPTNIIINPTNLAVKLSDFSIATHVEFESQPAVLPNVLEGSLSYMSPEQTGRMNRMVDYRTDFYSLGITFFEMLVGHLPFEADDLMELVHYHLAKVPPIISDLNNKVPLEVSAIVGKLLAKNAEDRYVTAGGIYFDLAKCAQEWQQTGRVLPFALGEGDISDRLKIPQKLYGREAQIKTLMGSFERVSKGASEMVFVTGYSGVGKSSLVHEIDKLIVKQRGYYISGKYDRLQKNIPYNAFTKAFDELASLILSEPEAKLNAIKQQLLETLGENGQLLIDFAPQFESIIGKQPQVQFISVSESQNLFNNIFKKIINIFATSQHPLVLFLDDMQWADVASLGLIKTFLSMSEYLLIIAAYRENEVDESHPLFGYMDSLEREGVTVNDLRLLPLEEKDISALLMDTLHVDAQRIQPLSAIVKKKTAGNPFFINVFLKSIYSSGALLFSYESHKWQWKLSAIENLTITDNVVDLLTQQIEKLSPLHRELISLAACIGTTFDLDMLTLISQRSSKEVALVLHDIVGAGLMLPVGGQYLSAEVVSDVKDLKEKVYYKFVHDKVQQAAYSLISAEESGRIHVNIGRILLKQKGKFADDLMFTILDHFNKGVELIIDEKEKLELARLNLIAGTRAKISNAYDSASHYLLSGIKLADPEQHWDDRYELVFELFKEYATCAYLSNDMENAEKYFNFLLEKSRTKSDKASVCNLKGVVLSHQLKYAEACTWFKESLKIYKVLFPEPIRKFDVLKEILKVKFKVGNKNVQQLEDVFDQVADADQKIIADSLNKLQVASLFSDVNLYGYTVAKTVNFALKNRIMNGLLQTAALYAVLLITAFNDMKGARLFGELVLRLIDNVGEEDLDRCRAYMAFGAMLSHWFQPSSLSVNYLEKSIKLGNRVGANYGVGLATGFKSIKFAFFGVNLEEVAKDLNKSQKDLLSIKHGPALRLLEGIRYMVDLFLGEKEYNEEDFISRTRDIQKSNYYPALYSHYTATMFFHYITGNYKIATELGVEGDKYFPYMKAGYACTIAKMIYFLSMIQHYPKVVDVRERKMWKGRMNDVFKIIKKWQKFCPVNYTFMYDICYAEYQRVFGKDKIAAIYYDKAVAEAQKLDVSYFIGISNECAGRFYIETNRPKLARAYIQDAHYAYLRWGAITKYEKMEEEYSQWLKISPDLSRSPELSLSMTASSTDSVHALDFVSIIKATQTISGEIVLNRLLEKMLDIMVENGGAERGVFIVENSGQLLIAAERTLKKNILVAGQMQPVESRDNLPLSMIRFVYRTQGDVVLHNAVKSGNFVKDPYIVENQSKSILCMPVLHKNQVVGILYLENNVATNVFTVDRFQALKLIASQAAISLENARLYTASGHFVPFPFLERLHKRNIAEVRLGDQTQSTLSIMFCDIRDFTALSDKQSPEETFQFINQFLGVMEPIIRENSGFTDKYIGDAIMALFDGDSDNAVHAAIQMIDALKYFNDSRIRESKSIINVGIGINTGDLMLGIIGNQERMESSVIGSPVNIAARVEDLTKHYGVSVLITEETRSSLQHQERFSLRLIDEVLVKGKTKPVKIWEVCDIDSAEVKLHKRVTQETFNQARHLFLKEKYSEAKKLFQDCRDEKIDDPVISFYLNECQKKMNQ